MTVFMGALLLAGGGSRPAAIKGERGKNETKIRLGFPYEIIHIWSQ
jgi:hypothetical protein